MESFFALLQKNVLDRQRWASREQLRLAIITWIERTYHRRQPAAAWPPDAHRIRDNQQDRTHSLTHPAPESTKTGAVPLHPRSRGDEYSRRLRGH
jgi:hypothetical protein